MSREPPHWRPRTILRFIDSKPTSTSIARVETDVGEGFLKVLGNPAGPHALACEWVGTQLAERLELATLDYALIEVTEDDEIPLASGGYARPGPAFITRAEKALEWGGGRSSLKRLTNPRDVAKLVAFDTWTLNCDRFAPEGIGRNPHRDNVLLSRERARRGKLVLKAIDHTHCFTCGADLTPRLARIESVQAAGVYGLFPEFRPLLRRPDLVQACASLRQIGNRALNAIVASIPAPWEVTDSANAAMVDFLVRRADFVAGRLVGEVFGEGDFGF
jgi:hypothetical protein